jgi:hypothetical protein
MAITTQPSKETQIVTQDFLAKVDMVRLRKAAQRLESSTMQVLIEGRSEGAVWGLVRNGEEKVYSTQIAHGYASCNCPDWAYRGSKQGVPCKHSLALALYALQHPDEPGERTPDLSLRKVRSEGEKKSWRELAEELYGA